MSLKAYFQDEAPNATEGGAGLRLPGLRLSVVVWHLCWAGYTLFGLMGLLLLPASPLVIAALVAITVPGAACVILLSRDSQFMRQALMWVWAVGALLAVALTGGISGPLAVWCILPLLAAVVLNQRTLITLGASLAFGITLFGIMISVWHGIRLPDEQEGFWLSVIANVSIVAGLGLAVLPALRMRSERASEAEEARDRLLKILTEQPGLLICLDGDGRVVAAYGEAPAGLDLKALLQLGVPASAHVPDRMGVKAAIETAVVEGRADIGFTPHAAMDHYVLLSLRRDTRVRWALEETGQPYEVRHLSFEAMKQPAHLARHPFGQIPTYEDGDLVLFETGSIVLHIAEKHSVLLPQDANARARAITWMFAATNTVEPPILDLVTARIIERDKPWAEARLCRRLLRRGHPVATGNA